MRILIVSALRDEGPYIVEWVAHHRAAGVTDFLLFTNDCQDGTDALLEALAPAGVVHLRNTPPPGKSVQWQALKSAWAHPLRKQTDWILGIDCDEFVNLRAPEAGLPGLIEASHGADAIVLPWRLFGHNGQVALEDHPTIETFTRAAPADCRYPVGATQFKTLFRARGPFRQIGVHRPRRKPSDRLPVWADGSGQLLPEAFAAAEQRLALYGLGTGSDLVQLNHYSVRSAESFLLKRARGLPNRSEKEIGLTYWVERNFNTVEDRSILGMAAATRAEMERLRALPGVAGLHAEALDRHRAMLAKLMRDEDTVRLLGRLLLAADSTPLDDAQIDRLVALYRNAASGG